MAQFKQKKKIAFEVSASVVDESSDGFQDKMYRIVLQHDQTENNDVDREIMRLLQMVMQGVNPRLITDINISHLTRQLNEMGLLVPPACAIPQAVRNGLIVPIAGDFRKHGGKELVYRNKCDNTPVTRHLSLVDDASAKRIVPDMIMPNAPQPAMAIGKRVNISGITLKAVLSCCKCIPLCPWPEIANDSKLYLFSANAIGVTFHSPLCIKRPQFTTLMFNHQSYDLPVVDMCLCRDYIKSEFDILTKEKPLTHTTGGISPMFMIKKLVEIYMMMTHKIAIDIKVAEEEVIVDISQLGTVPLDVLATKYKDGIRDLEKITMNFLDQINKEIQSAKPEQLAE